MHVCAHKCIHAHGHMQLCSMLVNHLCEQRMHVYLESTYNLRDAYIECVYIVQIHIFFTFTQ